MLQVYKHIVYTSQPKINCSVLKVEFGCSDDSARSLASEEKYVAQQQVRFIAERRPVMLNTSMGAFLAPQMAARDGKTQILICFSIAARYVWFIAG